MRERMIPAPRDRRCRRIEEISRELVEVPFQGPIQELDRYPCRYPCRNHCRNHCIYIPVELPKDLDLPARLPVRPANLNVLADIPAELLTVTDLPVVQRPKNSSVDSPAEHPVEINSTPNSTPNSLEGMEVPIPRPQFPGTRSIRS